MKLMEYSLWTQFKMAALAAILNNDLGNLNEANYAILTAQWQNSIFLCMQLP
jgi:hypothetical protein